MWDLRRFIHIADQFVRKSRSLQTSLGFVVRGGFSGEGEYKIWN